MSKTVSRQSMWEAQTPQLFSVEALSQAMKYVRENRLQCTDESQAIELSGICPQVIPNNKFNIKITEASDLVVASAIINIQKLL